MSNSEENKPVLIFDFDGTIADSMAMVSEIGNKLLPDAGRPEGLSKKDIKALRSMTIPQGLKYLGIPAYRLPKIALAAKQELSERIDKLEPIPGMVEVLKNLHDQDMELGNCDLKLVVKCDEISTEAQTEVFISFIDTGVSIFGKSRHIKQTLKKQKLKAKECIYIGDEIRDIEAAKALKMDCISVTWGINEKSALEAKHPSAIVDSPKKLESAILNIKK